MGFVNLKRPVAAMMVLALRSKICAMMSMGMLKRELVSALPSWPHGNEKTMNQALGKTNIKQKGKQGNDMQRERLQLSRKLIDFESVSFSWNPFDFSGQGSDAMVWSCGKRKESPRKETSVSGFIEIACRYVALR